MLITTENSHLTMGGVHAFAGSGMVRRVLELGLSTLGQQQISGRTEQFIAL
jgi:hypothetical protein